MVSSEQPPLTRLTRLAECLQIWNQTRRVDGVQVDLGRVDRGRVQVDLFDQNAGVMTYSLVTYRQNNKCPLQEILSEQEENQNFHWESSKCPKKKGGEEENCPSTQALTLLQVISKLLIQVLENWRMRII